MFISQHRHGRIVASLENHYTTLLLEADRKNAELMRQNGALRRWVTMATPHIDSARTLASMVATHIDAADNALSWVTIDGSQGEYAARQRIDGDGDYVTDDDVRRQDLDWFVRRGARAFNRFIHRRDTHNAG